MNLKYEKDPVWNVIITRLEPDPAGTLKKVETNIRSIATNLGATDVFINSDNGLLKVDYIKVASGKSTQLANYHYSLDNILWIKIDQTNLG